MEFIVKPMVCDYQVIDTTTHSVVAICNLQSNAEIIADVLNADRGEYWTAYAYEFWPYRKYDIHEM